MRATESIVAIALGLALGVACGPGESGLGSAARTEQGIIGGNISTDDDAVVMLSIGCSGSLIAPNVVLSAAHCLPSDYVGFGMSTETVFATRRVSQQFAAREYDAGIYAGSDIALLLLAFNVRPLGDEDVGAPVRLVGYGQSESSGYGTRRYVNLDLQDVSSLFVTTGNEGETACYGDSGGPMFMEIDGEEQVIGVASFVISGCDSTVRYTRVDPYLAVFIDEVVDAWTGPCRRDGNCDPGLSCPGFPDPDCDPCGLDGTCAVGCDDRDLDCPIGLQPGNVCTDREECESLLCIPAPDEPRLSYCSLWRDTDLPDALDGCEPPITLCVAGAGPDGEDICLFEDITPGAQGAPCAEHGECRANRCDPDDRICVELCADGLPECADGFECRAVDATHTACRLPESGGCSAGRGQGFLGALVLGVLVLLLGFRRGVRSGGAHTVAVLVLALGAACEGGEGSPDAAAPDAAAPDAAETDARVSDAAQPDAGSGVPRFDVTWNLTAGDPEATTNCAAAGVDTIQVVSQPNVGTDFVDLFDCAGGSGLTAPLPPGSYTVWVNALDGSNDLVARSAAQSYSLQADDDAVLLLYLFPVDGGFFSLTWTLVDTGDNPLTCAAVGAGGVSLLSTLVGTADAYEDIFDCAAGEGETAKLPVHDYTVVIDLLDDDVPPGSLATSAPRSVSIDFGNHRFDLGNFEFVLP